MRLIDADALWMDVIRSVDYCDDILEFIERQPTVEQSHWIPCSERLPEDDAYVLISKKPSQISGNKFSVTIGVRYTNSRSHKTEWRDSGFGYLSDDKVLAWMPLPSPYQEEGEEE